MISIHQSVMPAEVETYLVPARGDGVIVDGTLGEGGHAERFLSRYPEVKVVGIDADRAVALRASERLGRFGDRFELVVGWTDAVLSRWGAAAPDIVLLDLGISSFHYREAGRGFSFAADEPLDMRLDGEDRPSAAEIVNTMREDDLANLIYQYGEERFSRRIAKQIVARRREKVIEGALQLADIVRTAVPPPARRGRLHPATRTFQALRIAVNRELERLARLLEIVPALLAPGGRFGVLSFHSLEDRMVKQAFRARDSRFGGVFEILTKKAVKPSEEESRGNPPSRSAKFRVLRKPDEELPQ